MDSAGNIAQTEENIPQLAGLAVERAFHDALKAGQSVLTTKDGVLLEVFPDGTIREVRAVEPPTAAEAGQTATLR